MSGCTTRHTTERAAPELSNSREPNERVHMDLFGPLKTRSASGNKLILVITDTFTKYTELVPVLNKEASTVARAFFERWICRFGVPTVIISGNAIKHLRTLEP